MKGFRKYIEIDEIIISGICIYRYLYVYIGIYIGIIIYVYIGIISGICIYIDGVTNKVCKISECP